MVTIGSVGSAGGASSYYAKDNYYTNAQGLGTSAWFGKGAELLGLPLQADIQIDLDDFDAEPSEQAETNEKDVDHDSGHIEGREDDFGEEPVEDRVEGDRDGPVETEAVSEHEIDEPGEGKEEEPLAIGVTADELKSVLEGKVDVDTRLGYEDKDGNWQHMPGKDIVFAPSKSVSVMALVGGDTRLTEAFQDSVKTTLGYVEDHLASVHDYRKGESSSYRTSNITAALFTHDTSRNQDPLLHVHAVIGNITKDDRTDKWRSLNFRAIYKNTYALNRILQADFGKRIEALGYSVTTDQHGNVEIESVPKDVSRAFSSRRVEIEAHMEGRDGSFGERRTATLATRNEKVELPRDKLTSSWIERSLDKGFDPRAHIPDAAKSTPMSDNALAVSDAIEDSAYLKTTLSHAELVAGALESRHSDGNMASVIAHIDEANQSGRLVIHSDLKNDAVRTFTTQSQINAEREIQARLKSAPKIRPLKKNTSRLSQQVRAPQQMDGRTVSLNESQAKAVEFILTSKKPIIGIQGLAGVGKTTALGVMAKALEKPGLLGLRFGAETKIIAMAPTINAAAEIGEKTNAKDRTVQSYLKAHKGVLNGERPSASSLKTYRASVILHDETSMMSNEMMRDFLKVNEALGVRMSVMIGDTGQHGAVKAGPSFEMMQKNGMKTQVMDQIVRQQSEPLLDIANRLADGDFHGAFKAMGPDLAESPDFIRDGATAHVDDIQAGKDSAIIVLDNAVRKKANEAVRAVMKERGLLPEKSVAHETHAPTYLSPVKAGDSRSYRDGDKIEFRQDIYNREMIDGSVWTVVGRDRESNALKLERDGKIETWQLKKMEDQPFDHWRPETLQLSVKDEIRFKTHDKEQDIAREDKAKIVDINKKTMTVKLKDGRRLTIDREDSLAKQLVHAYATTSYAAQGMSIAHPKGIVSPYSGAANQQGMYVTGTRAIQSLKIFTSSAKKLLSRVETNTGKDQIATEAIGLNGHGLSAGSESAHFNKNIRDMVKQDVAERERTIETPSRGVSH